MKHRAMEHGRRQAFWYPFVRRITRRKLHCCLTTRVSKLSRQGCYLDLTHTLPAGTSVIVKIYAWPYFFQARGTVSRLEHGLGVAFENIESDYASALEACLLEAQQKQRKLFP